MKYKLMPNFSTEYNPMEQVFVNRGFKVNNIQDYLGVTKDSVLSPLKLKNMYEGYKLLIKHLNNKSSKIFLQVDSDADGYTSAALFLNYLDRVFGLNNLNIEYRIHNGKEHGVILDSVIDENGEKKYDLVILIDAGSNQFKEHEILHGLGTDVLVIDHHDCEEYSEHAVIINNQMSPEYTNKAMCGVGIAYKFCSYLDSQFESSYADEFLDLVAIGSIGDMMDMRSLETHYLTKTGLGQVQNPLISELVKKQEYSLRGALTRIGAAFYIVPLINATIRVGTHAEKSTMFKAMLDSNSGEIVPSTKRGCKGQFETIVEQATRNCTNVHARQRRSRESGALTVKNYIIENGIENDKVMLVIANDDLDKNLIGLVANQLMAEYKKPVLLLREYEYNGVPTLQGSGRGYDRSELNDFKGFLSSTKMFNFVEGHASAFGASLPVEKKDEFITYANEALKDFSFDSSYEVDYIFEGSDIDRDVVFEIGKMKSLWGKGFEEPFVAIKGLVVTPQRVTLLSPTSKPTIKITLDGGMTLMKFFSSQEEYQTFTKHKDGAITLDLICKCSINEWQGRQTPQLIIDEYEIMDEYAMIF